MARTATIRDETILEAARAVFLAHGVQATTAEVAERAGVSEGTLFKRFRSKDELFHAAMVVDPRQIPWIQALPGRVGRGDVREELVSLALEMVAFFRHLVPLMMMTWSSAPAGRVPEVLKKPDAPPIVAIRSLAAYFAAEAQRGRLRAPKPEIAARAFMAGLHSFVMMEVVMPGLVGPQDAEVFARDYVALLWSGLAPAGEPLRAPLDDGGKAPPKRGARRAAR